MRDEGSATVVGVLLTVTFALLGALASYPLVNGLEGGPGERLSARAFPVHLDTEEDVQAVYVELTGQSGLNLSIRAYADEIHTQTPAELLLPCPEHKPDHDRWATVTPAHDDARGLRIPPCTHDATDDDQDPDPEEETTTLSGGGGCQTSDGTLPSICLLR